MTPIEIREKGYQALMIALGPIDTIRFLQQAGWGVGDYTAERQQWLGSVSRESFWQDLQRIRAIRNAQPHDRACSCLIKDSSK